MSSLVGDESTDVKQPTSAGSSGRLGCDLAPYDDLPDDVRHLDRDTVRATPAFLAGVGFAVIRVRHEGRHAA